MVWQSLGFWPRNLKRKEEEKGLGMKGVELSAISVSSLCIIKTHTEHSVSNLAGNPQQDGIFGAKFP